MDRISHLPEPIIHRILSSLNNSRGPPSVEPVRMSVLSKAWFDLTASFPVLYFDIYFCTSRESFFKFVEYTTSRFCQQNVAADSFKLVTTLQEPTETDIVNRCLELVLKKGVKVLVVAIYDMPEYGFPYNHLPKYRLPDILLSVSVLQSLTISGCELPSSLMVDAVKFKSLIVLELNSVHIDDEIIKYLTTSCPLLQDLKILCCDGLKRFCVCRHQNLQRVRIICRTEFERLDIEAPNLSHLNVIDLDDRLTLRMNLASCKKLTQVTYYGCSLPNDFLSNFPFIENLHLTTDHATCNNLKWSSHSLRTLVLPSDCDLGQIEFNTPSLDLFIYGSESQIIMDKGWPLLGDLFNLKSCMQCHPYSYLDALWFQKLRQFLDKKNGFKPLNLYIHGRYSQECKVLDELYEIEFIDLEELNAIELPPYELQHVELELNPYVHSSSQLAFIDAVLWCCSPQHLTLRSSFPLTDFEDVVKFVSEKLLKQEDQGHTNIQIVSCPKGKTISFIKEEGTFFMSLFYRQIYNTFFTSLVIIQIVVKEEAG